MLLLGPEKPRRQTLLRRREQLISDLTEAVRSNRQSRSRRLLCRINHINELESLYAALGNDSALSGESPPLYLASSLFLFESFLELTADRKEQLFFVTGPEVSGSFILDQRIRFAHDRRSIGGVTGSHQDSHRALILLESFGHRLLAHFHSHPKTGAEATVPSGVDADFQGRLEQAGHVAVAGIFSRDGWIRFFRTSGPADVRVYGEGVEHHDTGVYRLTHSPASGR